MQQRQLRLGDILDDYCPRERRVTNHVVVAMIGDAVKQTRCSTCDADHEYKKARVPTLRRKKETAAPPSAMVPDEVPQTGRLTSGDGMMEVGSAGGGGALDPSDAGSQRAAELEGRTGGESLVGEGREPEIEGPVHRALIRATLPRTEGTVPTRQIPEFTIRQDTGRAGNFRAGLPHRHRPGGGSGMPGQFDGGTRHGARSDGARSGGAGGRAGHRSPAQHQRSVNQHGANAGRPGRKRSR